MDELNTLVLAYLSLAQDQRTKSEQVSLIEASRISQATSQKNKACQHMLINLFTVYTNISLSFYDICPVDSFERVN